MAGIISDFARRPRGVKIATFAAIGGVLGLLYWQLVYVPIEEDQTKQEAALVGEVDVQKKLRKDKSEFDDLVVRRKGLSTKIEQNQKALPTEAEMPAFFDMLSRKISEAGVEAMKRELKKEVTIDPNAGVQAAKPANAKEAAAQAAAAAASAGPKTVFLKVPVEIEISGTFYQLKRFFASLRPHQGGTSGDDEGVEKDRLVTIENLLLTEPRVKNSEIVLTARFTASTFRAVTEPVATPPGATPAPATPGGAKPATAPGAGSGTGAGSGSGAAFNRDLDGPANTPRSAGAQAGAAAGVADKRNKSVDPDDEVNQ